MTPSIMNLQVEVAQISSGEPSKVFGNCTTMYLGRKNTSTFYRILFKFSVSSIPNHCIISNALLKIYVQHVSRGNTSLYTPFALTQDWSVQAVNWINQPLFDPTLLGESKAMSSGGFYTFNITNLVSSWYNYQLPNYGFIMKNEEIQDMTYNQIVTLNNPVSAPIIEVTYTPLPTRFIEDIEVVDTDDTWRYSGVADVSYVKTLTCHIENIGNTPVIAKFESSPDDIHFICDGCSGSIIQPHKMIWATPYAFARCGRVAVKNVNPGETSRIKIWYQAQE
ncbi:MAG: DNRLRE domain-containing protein [Marinisporobacter sp.]|nr:DNRLRE domain-containing protein [Marinisporobacter sp.]